MLPRVHRLTRSSLFAKALSNGVRLKWNPYYLTLALPRLEQHPAAQYPVRFGFVVSKKVSKRAVQRNKVRRRLREIVRTRLKDFPNMFADSPHRAIVFIVRQDALKATYAQLLEAFNHTLSKAGKKV